jgi:N-acetylglucosaminyldiphosphoundecaprenol N-acetyl-beta-D-mannosaminyltransferase
MVTTTGQRIVVGRLPVDVLTFRQALAAIERLVEGGGGGAVFTPNVDHVVQAEHDEALASAYTRAALSLADGAPIIWASRLLRTPLPERLAGSDLALPLLALAAQRGWRVSFLGGVPGMADRAAAVVRRRFGTTVTTVECPAVRVDDAAQVARIAASLRSTAPQLVFVALGAPKQELLIDRMTPLLPGVVCLGLGATLDFIAGAVRRAPRWVRQGGLEWAWRLGQEPSRLWRRYLVEDPRFALIIARELASLAR